MRNIIRYKKNSKFVLLPKPKIVGFRLTLNMNKKVTYFILISISIFYLVFSQKSICQVTSNYKYLNDSNLIVEYIDSASQLKYNKPDSSKQILEKALGIARKNSLQINEAEILNRIGGIYYILGKYDLSMDYFSQAFEVYSELKNKKGIAASYNNMGMIYGVHSHYQKTIYYHKKSIKICKEINDIKLLGTNYFNLGIIYNEKGENDSALIFANKAIEQYNKLNLPEENIRVYN
ncbi:MAG: hypothetical protein C0598_03210, partial [Marinilabiliales bacterium]